ncbi:hypothetical protein FACS189459_4070 [Bacilli bacterium]|nr:hypothetical protein FACS189459_4070 [Bacilli bacterium]
MHCVDPAISETAMDVIVINKKNDKKISKKHSIENMIYDIQLEHMG